MATANIQHVYFGLGDLGEFFFMIMKGVSSVRRTDKFLCFGLKREAGDGPGTING